jgi:hypothetical protein
MKHFGLIVLAVLSVAPRLSVHPATETVNRGSGTECKIRVGSMTSLAVFPIKVGHLDQLRAESPF